MTSPGCVRFVFILVVLRIAALTARYRETFNELRGRDAWNVSVMESTKALPMLLSKPSINAFRQRDAEAMSFLQAWKFIGSTDFSESLMASWLKLRGNSSSTPPVCFSVLSPGFVTISAGPDSRSMTEIGLEDSPLSTTTSAVEGLEGIGWVLLHSRGPTTLMVSISGGIQISCEPA